MPWHEFCARAFAVSMLTQMLPWLQSLSLPPSWHPLVLGVTAVLICASLDLLAPAILTYKACSLVSPHLIDSKWHIEVTVVLVSIVTVNALVPN